MGENESSGEAPGALPWDNGDDQGFVVESGAPSFAQRLTRQQKLLRGGVALLAVLAAAFFLLGGPDATTSLVDRLHQRIVAAAPIPLAHVSRLAAVRLPPGSATIATLRISPAAGGTGSAYACWVSPGVVVNGIELGVLHLAALDGGSLSWRVLTPPEASAARCAVAADTVTPGQALLSIYAQTGASAACTLPSLYFTSDSGASWQAVAWPDPNLLVCAVSSDLVQGRIYAASTDALIAMRDRPAGVHGRLIVSADRGQSWQTADTVVGALSSFELLGIRPGGRLLAQTADQHNAVVSTLWESEDDGVSWRSLGALPGANAQVYVSQNPDDTANGGWGRLYLSADADANGAAASQADTFFATGYAGAGWHVIASLPVAPVDAGAEGVGVADAGVGPGGLLFVTRAMIGSNAHDFIPQLAFWIWEPRRGVWLVSPAGLPPNTLIQGESWSGSNMSLWMTIIHQGIPPTVQIATLTLTPQNGGR